MAILCSKDSFYNHKVFYIMVLVWFWYGSGTFPIPISTHLFQLIHYCHWLNRLEPVVYEELRKTPPPPSTPSFENTRNCSPCGVFYIVSIDKVGNIVAPKVIAVLNIRASTEI